MFLKYSLKFKLKSQCFQSISKSERNTLTKIIFFETFIFNNNYFSSYSLKEKLHYLHY